VLRILTATWLGLPAVDGRLWALDAGAVSALGFERNQHVIAKWNVEP
jgi:probable phosphoglycerate mutase